MRKLFGELGIDVHATEMSMSIHCDECGLEYAGGRDAKGIFVQRRRLFDPRYLRMLLAIKAFQRLADDFLISEPVPAEGQYPKTYGEFLNHHGFLQIKGSPQWFTVTNGSHSYIDKVVAAIDSAHTVHRVDTVVIATHADQALDLLTDPSELEMNTLGAFGYSDNETVLHRDNSILPKTKAARSVQAITMAHHRYLATRYSFGYQWTNSSGGNVGGTHFDQSANNVVRIDPGETWGARFSRSPAEQPPNGQDCIRGLMKVTGQQTYSTYVVCR